MKRNILLTIVISALLCVTACEKDYPEEVTYSGRGILGFKLDGKNWVTYVTGFTPNCIEYDSTNSLLQFNLLSKQEKVKDYPSGSIDLLLFIDKKDFCSDIKFSLTGISDKYQDISFPDNLDKSLAYFEFQFHKEQSIETSYSEVISGEIQFLRLDSIAVGTFETRLSNGIDTITITDGKFDYKLIAN
jgi:hypothetical protein